MIKIQIDNLHQLTQEYTNTITKLVASRVLILEQSLSHLNGNSPNFPTEQLIRFRPITKKIIFILGDNINIQNGQQGYINALNDYRKKKNNLRNINIHGLLQFCRELLKDNNQKLSELLICEAKNLINKNNAILNNYNLNKEIDIAIIKLAFDYDKYDEDISSPIRKYFREQQIVKFCPYCNTQSTEHKLNASGEVVTSYELDHFYDKASYPLLSYSLFNLVPSDHTCNVINKRRTKFTEEYHLNPHLDGYIDLIKFIPIGLDPDYRVSKIELTISPKLDSAQYKIINGNNQPSIEYGDQGNLNVFKIRSKHMNKQHLARTILKSLRANDTYQRHIIKYLKKLTGFNLKDNYKIWYETKLDTPFDPSKFNNKAFSKFSRDIHDYYYSININKKKFNKHIRDLIKES